jgi:hypothetical protein
MMDVLGAKSNAELVKYRHKEPHRGCLAGAAGNQTAADKLPVLKNRFHSRW